MRLWSWACLKRSHRRTMRAKNDTRPPLGGKKGAYAGIPNIKNQIEK